MKQNRDDLSFLHMLCMSGIDILEQMPLLAPCLRRLVPSFSLSLMRVDEACVPHAHFSEYFDEHSHQAFAQHAHLLAESKDDPAAFGTLLRNRRAYGTLIDTRPEYVAGTIYQQMFARNGIHHCMDLAIRTPTKPLGILGLFRERGTRSFDAADVAMVGRFYDALVHAYEAPRVPSVLDEVGGAILIADRNGRIEWASPQARRWLEDAIVGPDRARLVERGMLPDVCRRLVANVHGALSSNRSEKRIFVPQDSLPVPGGKLRLRAYVLEAAPGVDAQAPRVAIQLTLEIRRDLRVIMALSLSPLTPQQRRMAFGLWRGMSPQAIASELAISAGTFKAYRKDMYGRLGVGSAQALVERLNGLALGAELDLESHRPR